MLIPAPMRSPSWAEEGGQGTPSPASPGAKERVRRGWTQARPTSSAGLWSARPRLPLAASLSTLVRTPGPALGTAASLDIPGKRPLPPLAPASRGQPFLSWGLCPAHQAPAHPGTAAGLVRVPRGPPCIPGWPLASSEPLGSLCESQDCHWPRPSPQGPPASPGMAAGLVRVPRDPPAKPLLLLPDLRPAASKAVREARTRCVTSHTFISFLKMISS